LFKTCELSWKASTTEGLSFAFCRQLPTGCGLSVLQDLGTGVQDFFADAVKVSMRAKFIFAEGFQTSQFATDWFLIAASQMTSLLRTRKRRPLAFNLTCSLKATYNLPRQVGQPNAADLETLSNAEKERVY